MSTEAIAGYKLLKRLGDAGLLPAECHAVEVNMEMNGALGIVYRCWANEATRRCLGESLLAFTVPRPHEKPPKIVDASSADSPGVHKEFVRGAPCKPGD